VITESEFTQEQINDIFNGSEESDAPNKKFAIVSNWEYC
jgi:hypothetical protein